MILGELVAWDGLSAAPTLHCRWNRLTAKQYCPASSSSRPSTLHFTRNLSPQPFGNIDLAHAGASSIEDVRQQPLSRRGLFLDLGATFPGLLCEERLAENPTKP